LASTNKFLGLARGPIDHNASSVINSIADGAIEMGSAVILDTTPESTELLPRVLVKAVPTVLDSVYGIVVGGDADGIYSTAGGVATGLDINAAATGAGQGVVVVTQGRCLARVQGTNTAGNTAINIGDGLAMSTVIGILQSATSNQGEIIIARALQSVTSTDIDIIAVDIQREGVFGSV